MELGALKKIETYSELNNYMKLINEVTKEGNDTVDNILHIDEEVEGFTDITYHASSVSQDRIFKHWFKYKEGNLYGLAYCNVVDFKIRKATDAIYLDDFENVQNMSELWLCKRTDSLLDLVIGDKVKVRDITSYDVLNIGYLHMLQLNFIDTIGLICYQSDIGLPSLYVPNDVDDFEDWYMRKCKADAYQGFFGNTTAQDMFRIEFEVENTIFHLEQYKKIQI